MKYFLSLCLLIFFSVRGFSQNFEKSQIDSTLQIVEGLTKMEYPYGITLSLKSYDYSKKINYKEGMLASLLLVSRQQYELGKFDDALKNASEAENIAYGLSDLKIQSDALRIKGVSLTRLKSFISGRNELNKALKIAQTLKDEETRSSRAGVIFNDIAFLIDESKIDLDSVPYFYGKGYREFEKMALNNSLKNKTLSLACSNVGSSFLRIKQLDSAQFYLDRALQLANSVDHKVVIATTLNDLGSLYYLKKEYGIAISHFEKGIIVADKINNPFVLKSLYLGISKAFKKINDNINSEKFLSKYISLSEKLENSGNLNGEDKSLLEKERIIANPKSSNRTILFTILCSLLFLATIYFLIELSKKSKKNLDVETFVEIDTSKKKNNDENILKRLVFLASEDDPSFLNLFKSTYPDFYRKLNNINPNLIASEQKMCAFLRLDLTTKEIASCTNSSVRAVEAKKYRLRKKLSITSEEDLNIWMANL